jgi:phosphotransacetylase
VIPFRDEFQTRARERQRTIVFPEGEDERTLDAVARLQVAGLVRPVVIGSPDAVRASVRAFGGEPEGVEVIAHESDPRFDAFAAELHALRSAKGWTAEDARERLRDPLVFGAALVRSGEVHGSVAGAARTTGTSSGPRSGWSGRLPESAPYPPLSTWWCRPSGTRRRRRS